MPSRCKSYTSAAEFVKLFTIINVALLKMYVSLFRSLVAGDAVRRSGSSCSSKYNFFFMIATILAFFSLISTAMASNTERTFIMVKPDGVQRGLVGKIIERFEQKGFKLVAMKFMWPSKDLLEKHYSDLSSRPFFPGLVNYMSSGPVVPMVWEGLNVVKTGRQMLGATNPADSSPGTIRGDFCIQVGRNIIHGSDAVESAQKEIGLWFKENELVSWAPACQGWVYE